MKLDKTLNLVIPVFDEKDDPIFIHSAPIGRAIYEKHFRIIARVWNEIFSQGMGMMAGPRMAYTLLKDIATEDGSWEGVDGVENTLVQEIFRLTNVIAPVEGIWDTIPYTEAKAKSIINEDDATEVENALTFFTANSHMLRKSERKTVLKSALGTWAAQLTSLNSTEYLNSLPTLTKAAGTGQKPPPAGPGSPLSIPS